MKKKEKLKETIKSVKKNSSETKSIPQEVSKVDNFQCDELCRFDEAILAKFCKVNFFLIFGNISPPRDALQNTQKSNTDLFFCILVQFRE